MKSELDTIIAKQRPEMVKLVKAVLAKLRPRFPGAVEMVYDKKRGMVLGFCADHRASNVINSIVVYSKWINLFFSKAIRCPIPKACCRARHHVRHIRLTSADDLDRPAIKALMAEALKRRSEVEPKAKRQVLIRQRS